MSFKKPFRAVPVKLGGHYQRKQRRSELAFAAKFFAGAAAVGVVIGTGVIALDRAGRTQIATAVKPLAVRAGITRARAPQAGDYWRGCNDARAAGTAPIYSGEPGYREEMDGDGDGVACEPYQ